MKKFTKRSLLMLSVLLLLGVLWGCSAGDTEAGAPDPEAQQQTADTPEISVSDSLSYSDGARTLHFTCDETGKWQWRDDPEFPLDESYVLEMLETVDQMLAAVPLQNPDTPESYGLDSDSRYLTASGSDGSSVTFRMGDKTDAGSYYFTRTDLEGSVYVAPPALSTQLSRSIYAMARLPQLPEITADSASSITVSGRDDVSFTMEKDGDGRWICERRDVTEQVHALLEQMAQARITACIDFRPSRGVNELCGLDDPKGRLLITYTNSVSVESTFDLRLGYARDGGRYALLNDDTTVYLIPLEYLDRLMDIAFGTL